MALIFFLVLDSLKCFLIKGTSTMKEFYQRNHRWTEGLISAAKTIAADANLLV